MLSCKARFEERKCDVSESQTQASGERVRSIAEIGVMIALISVAAQVSIVVGVWKFTLQVLIVMLASLVFTPGQAAAAMAGYILLGACGLPVFSPGGSMGIARLAGPFGGFLYAYIPAAFLGSLVRRAICPPQQRAGSASRSFLADVMALVVVTLVIYGVETVHYVAIGMPGAPAEGIMGALLFTTIPYIPAEAIKGVAAFVVAQALRKALPAFAQR